MIQCMIFDLDDTLYPEREFVLPRLRAVAARLIERFGRPLDFEAALVASYESGRPGRLFDRVLEKAGLAPEAALVRELVGLYRGGPVHATLYPDVRPALERWGRLMPLALVTDGFADTQRRKVEALGLAPLFAAIVFTADLGPGLAKPHPAAFRQVRERIGFDGPALYVGDNPPLDVPPCRAMGWPAVRIVRPGTRFGGVAADDSCRPDLTIATLDELEGLVLALK